MPSVARHLFAAADRLSSVVLALVLLHPFACRVGASGGSLPLSGSDRIDAAVFGQLAKSNQVPAAISSDAVFLRRIYLDVIGTLPTSAETRAFLDDPSSEKRRELIDRLLERPEFADYWAMKWSDLLRVKAEFPINLWPNAAQAYHRWIHSSIRDNKPCDVFARELLTSSGSNFRAPPVNFYRAMQNREPGGIAQTVALTFMGARAERWPSNRLAEMSVFFSRIGFKSTGEWKEEIIFFDITSTPRERAVFPDGSRIRIMPGEDPREVFAGWLINPKNRWFAKNIANRAWSWLLGRGVIHERDDIRPDNPPVNPELMAVLERELLEAQYDLKHLYRVILNSKTYQLSSEADPDDASCDLLFARYPLRRLEAEVVIDALNQITGSAEKYSSAIPEPFTFIPENMRSISLPDGSITSPFLDLFGRSPRDSGLEGERQNRVTASQRLHLLNSTHVQRKLEQSRLVQTLSLPRTDPKDAVTELYVAILSRYPSPAEMQIAEAHLRSTSVKRNAVIDIAWALINSAEFLYRH